MELKNMKCTPAEVNAHDPIPSKPAGPQYPYGLRLHLDEETLKKLALEKLPEIGGKLMLQARVEVCEVSEHKSVYGMNRSLGLQITDLGLSAAKE